MNAVAITALHFLTFLGIGTLFATILAKRKIIQEHYSLITAYAISCIVGYVLFYIYAYSPWFGTLGTGLFYLAGIICFSILIYQFGKDPNTRRIIKTSVLPPLLIILAVCTFYSSITFTCQRKGTPQNEPFIIYQACLLYNAPGDNILPELFGNKLIQNKDLEPSGDWKLADRPPLQIGSVISLLDTIPYDSPRLSSYEVFSTFLQLGWIAGLWALLKSMKIKRENENFVLLASIFTGFYYYNSIYVWPKLLAAGFAIAAISLLFYRSPYRLKNTNSVYYDWGLIALLLTLSLLSHGSTLFTLIPLAVYVLAKRKLPSLKVLALVFGVVALLYSPWLLYKERSTTSDRLVKWHFAGVMNVDDRSTLKTIADSYGQTNPRRWTKERVRNVESLFKKDSSIPFSNVHVAKDPSERSIFDRIRKQEFFATIPALGFLNIGWLAIFFTRKRDEMLYKKLKPLIILGLSSLALWCLLMFMPGSTIVHQNSYTTMMLLITFLTLAISTLGKRLRYFIVIAQILLFFIVWVFHIFYENHQPIAIAFTISVLGLTSIVILIYRTKLSRPSRLQKR